MKSVEKNDILKEIMPYVLGTIKLSVARKIHSNEIDPEAIKTREQLIEIVKNTGKNDEDGFEIHTEVSENQIKVIRYSVDIGEYTTAIVLLVTLIDSELNIAIRILLRVRNFSHAAISNAIQGTDFRTKMEILLPLIGINLPERIRQLAFESQKIRNLIVHFKAKPNIYSDESDILGDFDKTQNMALEFITRNPIDRAVDDIKSICQICVNTCPVIRKAQVLLQSFGSYQAI